MIETSVEGYILKEVKEVERHLHSAGRWFGLAAAASGTVHVADRIAAGIQPFKLTAGASDWGNWVNILGSTDTPTLSRFGFFDPHEIQITTANDTVTYFMQFTRGASGAAGLSAGTYTEFTYTPNTNQIDAGPVAIQTGRAPAGSLLWARCLALGATGKTIDFYLGIHEYDE